MFLCNCSRLLLLNVFFIRLHVVTAILSVLSLTQYTHFTICIVALHFMEPARPSLHCCCYYFPPALLGAPGAEQASIVYIPALHELSLLLSL